MKNTDLYFTFSKKSDGLVHILTGVIRDGSTLEHWLNNTKSDLIMIRWFKCNRHFQRGVLLKNQSEIAKTCFNLAREGIEGFPIERFRIKLQTFDDGNGPLMYMISPQMENLQTRHSHSGLLKHLNENQYFNVVKRCITDWHERGNVCLLILTSMSHAKNFLGGFRTKVMSLEWHINVA